MPKKKQTTVLKSSLRVRPAFLAILMCMLIFSVAALLVIKSKEYALEQALLNNNNEAPSETGESFPVSVNSKNETIEENPLVEIYFNKNIAQEERSRPRDGWFHRTLALLSQLEWYQNLASPSSRILVIDSGQRHEEVAANFGSILKWNDAQRNEFTALVAGTSPAIADGKFAPGQYVAHKDASPEAVAALVLEQFEGQVLSRYTPEVEAMVPLKDALVLASLLEREAYSFEDMRYIAGVIWNRLFIDMNLQIDASLQYAKADEHTWWPMPLPKDKYIDSPFNTYQNVGLPPSPIANPSLEAILAALNPKETECIFYFHDQNGGFHCTETYEEHVALLKQYYGRGR